MERLREEDQIHLAVADGNLFHVAQPIFHIFDAVPQRLLPAHSIILAEVSTAITFLARRQQKRKGALARAQIGDDHGRQQPQQRLGQALPGLSGT